MNWSQSIEVDNLRILATKSKVEPLGVIWIKN